MINYEQAVKKILKTVNPLPFENAPIEDSAGRIAGENVYSQIEMPPFDKSAMDGYAVNILDTKTTPAKLKCIGLIQAGEAFKKKIKKGQCVKIMTGAALPKNSDSVVMVEGTRAYGETVELLKSVRKWENVCFKGEDIGAGQRVLKKGTKISDSDVAILATVGLRFVKTVGKPRVSILNTGGEITPLGNKLSRNKIYNSNGPMLEALLKSDGIAPKLLGIAKDNATELKKCIKNGLTSDMLLISGGVSMGDYDLVPDILCSLGAKKIFHKVNIKPGKPLFFGVLRHTVVFGIPGNPVSNFLSYLIFIRPALYKMMGYKHCKPEFKEGIIQAKLCSKSGRRHFVLVKITKKENRYYLGPLNSHGSADTLALSKADGFMVIDENTGIIRKNSKMPFITWKTI